MKQRNPQHRFEHRARGPERAAELAQLDAVQSRVDQHRVGEQVTPTVLPRGAAAQVAAGQEEGSHAAAQARHLAVVQVDEMLAVLRRQRELTPFDATERLQGAVEGPRIVGILEVAPEVEGAPVPVRTRGKSARIVGRIGPGEVDPDEQRALGRLPRGEPLQRQGKGRGVAEAVLRVLETTLETAGTEAWIQGDAARERGRLEARRREGLRDRGQIGVELARVAFDGPGLTAEQGRGRGSRSVGGREGRVEQHPLCGGVVHRQVAAGLAIRLVGGPGTGGSRVQVARHVVGAQRRGGDQEHVPGRSARALAGTRPASQTRRQHRQQHPPEAHPPARHAQSESVAAH